MTASCACSGRGITSTGWRCRPRAAAFQRSTNASTSTSCASCWELTTTGSRRERTWARAASSTSGRPWSAWRWLSYEYIRSKEFEQHRLRKYSTIRVLHVRRSQKTHNLVDTKLILCLNQMSKELGNFVFSRSLLLCVMNNSKKINQDCLSDFEIKARIICGPYSIGSSLSRRILSVIEDPFCHRGSCLSRRILY